MSESSRRLTSGRRIMVIEQRHSGHLLVYVREIIEAARRLGHEPILAVGEAVPFTPEFAEFIGDLDVTLLTFTGELTPRTARRLGRQSRAEAVIVPHGDELAARIGRGVLRSTIPTVLLIMRDPRWEWRNSGATRRLKLLSKLMLLKRASRRARTKVVWLRSYGTSSELPHVFDPFISDGTNAEVSRAGVALRDQLGMERETFWFVVTGAITDRKNVPMIGAAVAAAATRLPHMRLGVALIGPQRTSIPLDLTTYLENMPPIRVVSLDRMISNFEMNAAVAAADAVIMAYSTHSPNSTMLKCLALGTRLVVAGPNSVQSFAKIMGFSHVVSLNQLNLVNAIESAALAPESTPVAAVPTGRDFADGLIAFAIGT